VYTLQFALPDVVLSLTTDETFGKMDEINLEGMGINLDDMDVMDLVDDENPEWTLAARGAPQKCSKCKKKKPRADFMEPKGPRQPLSNITNKRALKVRKQCNRCRDLLRPTVERQAQKKREGRQHFLQQTYGTILPWREVKARMFER